MTSPNPHADDLLAAYAVDAVDADERRLVEAHLRDCALCREDLARYAEAAVHLMDGRDIAPPADVRNRVLDAVAEQVSSSSEHDGAMTAEDQHARRPAPAHAQQSRPAPAHAQKRKPLAALWGLAAAGVIAVGGFAVLQDRDEDLSPAQQVVQADDAERFEVEYEGETLAVVSSDSLNRWVLLSDDLPALSQGEVYQAWWVDEAGDVTSAGVVDGEADPERVEMPLQGTPDQPTAVALSVEPAGGSEQPTTEPLLAIELAD